MYHKLHFRSVLPSIISARDLTVPFFPLPPSPPLEPVVSTPVFLKY